MDHKTTSDCESAAFEYVSPQYARELLEINTRNRPYKPDKISLYIQEMREGKFITNGETIKIDTNNQLIDGQNRLKAIATMPEDYKCKSLIVRGLLPEAFDTIDINVPRSAADVMFVAGHKKYPKFIPAVIRKHHSAFVLKMEMDAQGIYLPPKSTRKVSNSDCVKIYEHDSDLILFIARVSYSDMYKQMFSSVLVGAILLYLLRDKSEDKEVVSTFFDKLSLGADLQKDSSILRLRTKLLRARVGMRKFDEGSIVKEVLAEYYKWKKVQA